MKKVLWITNIPSPYRVKFFNELGKHCKLTVICEKMNSSERDSSWSKIEKKSFNLIVLGGISIGVAESFSLRIVRHIWKNDFEHIIVTNYSDPIGILTIAMLRAQHIPYCIEGDGAFPGFSRGIKGMLKRWIISNASICFSTSTEHDKYYRLYNAEEERIVRYPFTSIKEKEIVDSPIDMDEKRIIRKQLNMTDSRILLSVGRFSYQNGYGKGFDILMKIAEHIDHSVGIYIVGDEPTEEFINWKRTKNLNNVHFIGFLNKEDLSQYYKASDCFALLSKKEAWGLVINEAMAHGLPIISSDKCIAGLELVEEGRNGHIVSVQNTDAIIKVIGDTLHDTNATRMGQESVKRIRTYTIEKMVDRHIEILNL